MSVSAMPLALFFLKIAVALGDLLWFRPAADQNRGPGQAARHMCENTLGTDRGTGLLARRKGFKQQDV